MEAFEFACICGDEERKPGITALETIYIPPLGVRQSWWQAHFVSPTSYTLYQFHGTGLLEEAVIGGFAEARMTSTVRSEKYRGRARTKEEATAPAKPEQGRRLS
jgi:hypothetical protein